MADMIRLVSMTTRSRSTISGCAFYALSILADRLINLLLFDATLFFDLGPHGLDITEQLLFSSIFLVQP
jgi:hypothetical protein